MKLTVPSLTLAATMLLGLTASAEVSPFRLRVEQTTKSENEKNSKTQKRSLKIHVSNSSKESAELRAKYVFFGRSVAKGDKDVVKLDEGEKALTVGPQKTEMAESAIASTSYEEASAGKGGKKTEASGDKFIGYGVQLFHGEKMVAEYYDPLSGKEHWAKAYPSKLPTAPKK